MSRGNLANRTEAKSNGKSFIKRMFAECGYAPLRTRNEIIHLPTTSVSVELEILNRPLRNLPISQDRN